MAQSFSCPQCGAPVPYESEVETVDCPFCGSRFQVPQEQLNAIQAKKAWAKAKPWVIIFVLVVFVLPTCLGLFGALIGGVAGIQGPIIAIFAGLN